MVSSTNNGKRTDLQRWEELQGALYASDSDCTVTISVSNFNWLMDRARRWINRPHEPRKQKESFGWTEEELSIMKRNGITTNNARTRIRSLGWSRDEAVNTPKVSEEERRERVATASMEYHAERNRINEG